MIVTLTGTGTSQGVPVIGCKCRVCTSEDPRDKRLRSALSIMDRGIHIVIDAGPDFRNQMLAVGAERLDGLLITHHHNDHIAGLDDIRPFNFKQNEEMSVYVDDICASTLQSKFDYIFAKNPYPGAPRVRLIHHNYIPFTIGHLDVMPLKVMHGKLPITAYRIGKLAYVTDANVLSEQIYDQLKGVEVLILNALRWEKHHSHFTIGEAIDVAERVGARNTYFTHISHYLGKHKEVAEDLPKGCKLAYDGLEILL